MRNKILEEIHSGIFYQQNFSNDGEKFVAWYLRNIYQKSEVEVRDAITDGADDKGIDAVFIDDDRRQVIIIQGKFYASSIDASPLEEIVSSWMQIRNIEELQRNANVRVRNKLAAVELALKDDYEVVFELLTTGVLTAGASKDLDLFRNTMSEFEHPDVTIDLVDNDAIQARYDEAIQKTMPDTWHEVPLVDGNFMELTIANFKTVVSCIKLSDLVKFKGIKERSLFRKNVRQALGLSNKVNKGIRQTLEGDNADYFFLYHNGITGICDKLEVDATTGLLRAKNLSIVNGCQSLTTIQSCSLSTKGSNANMLFRIYEIPQQDIADKISIYTNSQSAVKPRDLRSNDKKVIAIKREYEKRYPQGYFILKRGEERPADKDANQTIDLVLFAKNVMAWYCQKPNLAYNENKIFDKYFDLLFRNTYLPEDIWALIQWFNFIDSSWNANSLGLKEDLLATPSYSKFHLLGALQSCFCARNNQLDKVPFPSATINALSSKAAILKLAVSGLNSALSMAVNEAQQKDKILNIMNWLKTNDSFIKVQNAMQLTMSMLENLPGGDVLGPVLLIPADKFFLRLKAE